MGSPTITLWSSFKALPWYWKAILGVFFLVAMVGAYVIAISRRGGGDVVTNEMIVDHSRAKTDQVVHNFQSDERMREAKRQELKKKRRVIKTKMEEHHAEHENIVREIDRANTGGELLDLAERLRKRNERRKRS